MSPITQMSQSCWDLSPTPNPHRRLGKLPLNRRVPYSIYRVNSVSWCTATFPSHVFRQNFPTREEPISLVGDYNQNCALSSVQRRSLTKSKAWCRTVQTDVLRATLPLSCHLQGDNMFQVSVFYKWSGSISVQITLSSISCRNLENATFYRGCTVTIWKICISWYQNDAL